MHIQTKTIANSLSAALKASPVPREDFNNFKSRIVRYVERINSHEREENLKTHLMDFLKGTFKNFSLEQQGTIDFVIRSGKSNKSYPAVLFEHKRSSNKAEMISKESLNKKAFHELILHFMRERSAGNTLIRKLIICSEDEFYIFDSSIFERLFYKNTTFKRSFDNWQHKRTTEHTTEFFYKEIAAPFIEASEDTISATHFSISPFFKTNIEDVLQKEIIRLYHILSPQYLLNAELPNDSNSLNQAFYEELLHIVGLKEHKDGSGKKIIRLNEKQRNSASLIENVISQLHYEDNFNSSITRETYGENTKERAFRIAIELCLTWINRLLFLKLLEGQLVKFHLGEASYRFLNSSSIGDYDDLRDLFFKVLAEKESDRPDAIKARYGKIPYLNSSLFQKTELEKMVGIESLNAGLKMPYFNKTIMKDDQSKRLTGDVQTLDYLFGFLDAYDFGAVSGGDVRENSKTIINASVLGLIFEKINGYKEGAIFTPGYITMFMSREVIEKTVIEAFASQNPTWEIQSIEDLKNYLLDYRSQKQILNHNKTIDDLKICDPAVGSGHFLVACLNELISLKSKLGILADKYGNRITEYDVFVDNDELIILKADSDEVFSYQIINDDIPSRLQNIQKTLFHEKQKIIENCLFGVDINPNSVRICQLRLWIELLKSAYYKDVADWQLETLPNIDINIKCGNSLLSRYSLDANLSTVFSRAGLTVAEYKTLIFDYKNTRDKVAKQRLQERISNIKQAFQDEALRTITQKINAEKDRLLQRKAQPDLLIFDEEEQEAQDAKTNEINIKLQKLEKSRAKAIQRKTFLSALEWRYEFPEVLDVQGNFKGFDIIIANPPYMRVQEIKKTQPEQRLFYEKSFSSARGSYDLANLFFELAGNLSNKIHHNNIFIFPHKLFNSQNGEALREYLMQKRNLKKLIHFGANQIFESAITYTCIAMFNEEQTDEFEFKRYQLGANFESDLLECPQVNKLNYRDILKASNLYGNNQWVFFDTSQGYEIFEKIYLQTSSIEKKFEDVFQGIATSRDSLYISKKINETKDNFLIRINPDEKIMKPTIQTQEMWVEKKFFRPFLMGRDVHRYKTLETERLVFYPYHKNGDLAPIVRMAELKRDYPLTYAYVTSYRDSFSDRESGKALDLVEFYAYIYPKNLSKFDQDKLVSMEICSVHPNITIDRANIYHNTKVYSLVKHSNTSESYEYFSGILNSKLFWWFLMLTGDTLQHDSRTIKTNYIKPFPLPQKVSVADENKISSLVKKLISNKSQGSNTGQIQILEDQINDAVFDLYDLNKGDIAIIESVLKPDLSIG
jgi:adenine-specific DNA-methyltransferase